MSKGMRSRAYGNQAGFTLLELLVAMVATLVVTGAMYGLLAGGKSAFRREPELSDRQQQIRIAMALIERDAIMAGQDMGRWFQVFSPGLDSFGAGPGGTSLPSVVIPAQGGVDADAIEMRGNDGLCPSLGTCAVSGSEFKTWAMVPPCMNLPGMIVLTNRQTGAATVLWACLSGGATSGACDGGGGSSNGHVTFPSGASPGGCNPNNPSEECNANSASRLAATCPANTDCDMSAVQAAGYQIRIDALGVPDLWRSPRGGLTGGASGACALPPGGSVDGWQLVARGIEDLQVLYKTGNPGPLPDGWRIEPQVVIDGQPNTITREIQVTLSARSLAPNLQGQQTSAQGAAVRGQVTRTITPRSALYALQEVNQWR